MKKPEAKSVKTKRIATYAFIDASNIIYGTRNEGWRVDFEKLYKYLRERYNCRKIYYFGGLDSSNEKQKSFYKILKRLGFELIVKPVKFYPQPGGGLVRKANCDVDLTFYAMRDIDKFDRGIFLTGDGDFFILFEHFIKLKRQVIVIANARRTAKEIKNLKMVQFNDLGSLKKTIER